jgi:hypothetical protein
MAFPQDLSNVVVFKLHPAIGIARVSDSEDFYVFGTPPTSYKSNGLMKRQAVQFRIFAYGDNHEGLGELTPKVMAALNITATWSAKVANRKIAKWRNVPLGGTDFVIAAEAASDDANGGRLVGTLPGFDEGAAIPLGQITATGLFIPAPGRVFRKTAGEEIEPYPATSKTVADTTCDGSISVRLRQGTTSWPVLPACIVVAPQDFSPDKNEATTLWDFLKSALQIPTSSPIGNLHNQTARAIDQAALEPGTHKFDPGIEVCIADQRSEVVDLKSVFYRTSQDPTVDPREMRVRYKSTPTDVGAVPGQLTSGLCSPWQGDFTACVGYWTEHLPIDVFLDEDSSIAVKLFRRRYADHDSDAATLETGDDFDRHVDKVGVTRIRGGKPIETEREPGDDIPDGTT